LAVQGTTPQLLYAVLGSTAFAKSCVFSKRPCYLFATAPRSLRILHAVPQQHTIGVTTTEDARPGVTQYRDKCICCGGASQHASTKPQGSQAV